MTHPLEGWPLRHRRRWLLGLVLVWTAIEVPLIAVNGPLTTDEAPLGIASLQVAGTTEKAERIVAEWERDGSLDEAGFSLGLDFAAMPVYSTLIVGVVAAVAVAGRRRGWRTVAAAGVLLAWGAWLAALLDIVETGGQSRLIDDPSASGWPAVVRAAALGKFALLGAGLLFVVTVGAANALRPADEEH